MWDLIVSTLYLFLPAYAANMAPVLATRWNILSSFGRSLDGGKTFAGKPLLGPHKTVRGVVVGLVAGIIVALLQYVLLHMHPVMREFTLFPYKSAFHAILWGLALGGGALLGDMGKSFIKRRLNMPAGFRWFPWDQLDMVFGALVLGSLLYRFSLPMVATLIILTPLLGLLVNLGGYMLKVKEAW